MLETIDLSAKLKKSEYREATDTLDLRLAELQRGMRSAQIPVVVVFEGWDAAGKGTVLSRLLQPLDPRGFKVHYIAPPSEGERFYPAMWRFWMKLPEKGVMSIFDHSWYRQVLGQRVEGDTLEGELSTAYERIRVFEHQLIDDGAVIVKFFLHITKKEQARRFKRIGEDPAYSWRIGKDERKRHKKYQEYLTATEDMLRETSTSYAPWTIVPATDERFAIVKVFETFAAAFERALSRPQQQEEATPPLPPRRTSVLDHVDLSLSMKRSEYNDVIEGLQLEVRRLQHLCYHQRVPVAIVYEGWDAAGKGGNIRRLVRELDPRGYEVIPISAPQGEEKTHHYLWRFWRALPKAGHFAIFDRSWYGRLMVERVEGFATHREWSRAYREINEFEQQLVDFGTILIKFWIHVSKEEQLRRFKSREVTPHKKWKITEEDWRNREKWDEYWNAVSDMIERTSTIQAPWTIIEGNEKLHARVRALHVVIDRLQGVLES